ncbi:MAG: Site-specific recombinase, partial [Mycobacterium sp.]|nr:Site-specific recombinase [Mycobacterium sp.]
MGLTSSHGVTVARTLSVRATSRPTHFLPPICVDAVGHTRLGYARASTAGQSLDSLAEARVTRISSEKISTRAPNWTRPSP